ncbi:MAG: hypothetical protein AUH69_02680 [Actinobacteria bacterium 13_1_40CM_4_65_12]|nr:MAG: hypothetical protein AUH69_02680 [Actinobacteria bacterium 13_1_40CM_4_65_12]
MLEETQSESGIRQMGLEHDENDPGLMNVTLRHGWTIEPVAGVRQFKRKHLGLITRTRPDPNWYPMIIVRRRLVRRQGAMQRPSIRSPRRRSLFGLSCCCAPRALRLAG